MTDKEILAARIGFREALTWVMPLANNPAANLYNSIKLYGVSESKRRFPLPPITQPRIVPDDEGYEWRWTPECGLEMRGSDRSGWCVPVISNLRRPDIAKLVGALLLYPTETVPHPADA